MIYVVQPSRFLTFKEQWEVEAVDFESEGGNGQIYITTFSGEWSKARADEYAAWKNSQVQL